MKVGDKLNLKMYLDVECDGVNFIEVKIKFIMKELKFIVLKNIFYCILNRIDIIIFVFNYYKSLLVVECYVVVCDSEDKVKFIVLVLYVVFCEGYF